MKSTILPSQVALTHSLVSNKIMDKLSFRVTSINRDMNIIGDSSGSSNDIDTQLLILALSPIQMLELLILLTVKVFNLWRISPSLSRGAF